MVENLFRKIETLEFEANLAVASGMTLFQINLSEHSDIQELISQLQKHPEYRNEVIRHINQLLAAEVEPGITHPNDFFIASYLWTLNSVDTTLAYRAATLILSTPQMVWARRIAKLIHESCTDESSPEVLQEAISNDTND